MNKVANIALMATVIALIGFFNHDALSASANTLTASQELTLTTQTGLSFNNLLKQAQLVSFNPGLTTFDVNGNPTFGPGISVISTMLGSGVSSNSTVSYIGTSAKFSKPLVFPVYEGDSFLTTLQPYLVSGDAVYYYSSDPVADDAKYKTGFFASGVKFYAVFASQTGIDELENAAKTVPAGYDVFYDDYEDCSKTNGKCDNSFDPSEAASIAIWQRGEAAVAAYNARTGSHAFFWTSPSGEIAKDTKWDWSLVAPLFVSQNQLSVQTQSQQESCPSCGIKWAQHISLGIPSWSAQTSLTGSHTPEGAISYAQLLAQVPQVTGIKVFGPTGITTVLQALR